MANENYLIPIEDRRFPATWCNWSERILTHLAVTPTLYGSDYLSTFDFQVFTPNQAPEKEIPRRLYQTLARMRSSTLNIMYLGYDTEYCPAPQLAKSLTSFMDRRKRFDYDIHATSAYAMTHSLDIEFLDYPIPRLNVVAVTFIGQREII